MNDFVAENEIVLLRTVIGDLQRLVHEQAIMFAELDQRMGAIHTKARDAAAALNRRCDALQAKASDFDAYVERIGHDFGNLSESMCDVNSSMAAFADRINVLGRSNPVGIRDREPPKKSPRGRKPRVKNLRKLPYPRKTAREIARCLGQLEGFDPRVETVGERLYVDLADIDDLPFGLTSSEAKDVLQRAKLTLRPRNDELDEIGWTCFPSTAVVIALPQKSLTLL